MIMVSRYPVQGPTQRSVACFGVVRGNAAPLLGGCTSRSAIMVKVDAHISGAPSQRLNLLSTMQDGNRCAMSASSFSRYACDRDNKNNEHDPTSSVSIARRVPSTHVCQCRHQVANVRTHAYATATVRRLKCMYKAKFGQDAYRAHAFVNQLFPAGLTRHASPRIRGQSHPKLHSLHALHSSVPRRRT